MKRLLCYSCRRPISSPVPDDTIFHIDYAECPLCSFKGRFLGGLGCRFGPDEGPADWDRIIRENHQEWEKVVKHFKEFFPGKDPKNALRAEPEEGVDVREMFQLPEGKFRVNPKKPVKKPNK